MDAGKGGLGGKGVACSFFLGFYLNLYYYINLFVDYIFVLLN